MAEPNDNPAAASAAVPAAVAVISGANRGIGAAIARELMAHGYRVSLGARDPAALDRTFGGATPDRLHHRYDAQDRATTAAWVDRTVDAFGRIDALVNCAGILGTIGLEDDDEEELDLLWEVNVKGPLRLTRACLPHLAATGRGRIVNVVSLSGKRVANGHIGYSLTKFAAMALTHTSRHVGWDKGIRATALCPGFVRTDMTAHVATMPPEEMTQPETVAHLARTAIELPNNAVMPEILVNCRLENIV